jgi:hypothetical protein
MSIANPKLLPDGLAGQKVPGPAYRPHTKLQTLQALEDNFIVAAFNYMDHPSVPKLETLTPYMAGVANGTITDHKGLRGEFHGHRYHLHHRLARHPFGCPGP